VTAAASVVDHVSAPKSYDELFRKYYLYVVNLVNKHGITDDNKEDVASEILTRFMERGFLDVFDSSLVFEFNGEKRPARFKSFLSKFVLTYVQGHCDKQKRLAKREWYVCDMQVQPEKTGSEVVRWVDLYGDPHEGHEDAVLEVIMEQGLAQGLREHLATVPRRAHGDRCDLVALFDAVREQALDRGHIDIKALKDVFGVSPTAMHSWVWWLKENIAAHLGLPVPPKRPRVTRPKQQP
jgi:hypothetical protein